MHILPLEKELSGKQVTIYQSYQWLRETIGSREVAVSWQFMVGLSPKQTSLSVLVLMLKGALDLLVLLDSAV